MRCDKAMSIEMQSWFTLLCWQAPCIGSLHKNFTQVKYKTHNEDRSSGIHALLSCCHITPKCLIAFQIFLSLYVPIPGQKVGADSALPFVKKTQEMGTVMKRKVQASTTVGRSFMKMTSCSQGTGTENVSLFITMQHDYRRSFTGITFSSNWIIIICTFFFTFLESIAFTRCLWRIK